MHYAVESKLPDYTFQNNCEGAYVVRQKNGGISALRQSGLSHCLTLVLLMSAGLSPGCFTAWESRGGWHKYLGSCHPTRRSGWSSRLLTSAWSSQYHVTIFAE